ncbi:MAG: efflux RND transporter periplasmic adaptor subunit [Pirellulales bacterium]|nr:efflux RND transporter periplasmic adaptor subunit [Pirellulales bacterium]
MRSNLTLASLRLTALWALIATCVGCSHSHTDAPAQSKAAAEPAPVVVTTANVEERSVQRTVGAVGTLLGYEEVTLTPKVEGRVTRLHHDVGDRVRPGELLIELDATDFELAVDEAQRALELELARLGLKQPPDDTFDVAQLPSVVRAQYLLDNAAKKKTRVESLRQRNVATEQEMDQVLTDLNVADANLQQTRLEAEATLAAARLRRAALAMARQRLDDTRILAPTFPELAGDVAATGEYVIAERLVSEGEMVRSTAATTLMRLVMDHPLKLTGTIPERYSAEVTTGQTVKLQVEAYGEEVFEGKVSRVNPTIDSRTRTFEIEALIQNSERRLKAGGFAKFAVLTRVDNQARTIPLEALVSFAGVTKVFEVRDGRAYEVEVSPGVRGRGWVEVGERLQPNSVVVTSGQSQLADGAAVQLREQPPASVARRTGP